MPLYPGTPAPEFHLLSNIVQDGFAERILVLSSHAGTHVDLPSHILDGGETLDDFPAERFIGPGLVLELRGTPGGVISVEMLEPFRQKIMACEFLLFRSGWDRYWGTPGYYAAYPVLSPEAALWLAGFSLKGVGVDAVSVDPPEAGGFPVHARLLQSGIIIVENLAGLDSIPDSPFIFCCLPLKMTGAEASPVRAVALVEEGAR